MTAGSTSLRMRCTSVGRLSVLRRRCREDVEEDAPVVAGRALRLASPRRRPRSLSSAALKLAERRVVCAAVRRVGDDEDGAVEARAEALGQQVVGLRVVSDSGQLPASPKPRRSAEHRQRQHDEERGAEDERRPRVGLDHAAPAVPERAACPSPSADLAVRQAEAVDVAARRSRAAPAAA